MSEFKGTKGEWEYVDTHQHPTEENEYHSIIQLKNFAISITNVKCISIYETEANAKLISCAPEMLQMLIKQKDYLFNENGYSQQYFLLEDLIKKATT